MSIAVGTQVNVQMGDGSVFRTRTRSQPWHSVLDGSMVISVTDKAGGCVIVALDRVTEAWTELEDDWKERRTRMHHYQARRRTRDGQHCYDVIQVYRKYGRSVDGVLAGGETKAELIADLKRQLADVKRYRTIVEQEQL